jgi:lipoyl(octanoyl) transferase
VTQHPEPPAVRRLGIVDYESTWREMQAFTEQRGPDEPDQIWLLQHPPVYTLGMAGDPSHVLATGAIPVVQIDRGGQVTYHGPGQLIVYPLLDLRRLKLGVRDLVSCLEQAVIDCVANYGVSAAARPDAPGVYVGDRKLASLGLRVRRGCSYHGLALNIAMDLKPFDGINPCGHEGLEVTQLSELIEDADLEGIGDELLQTLLAGLGYSA